MEIFRLISMTDFVLEQYRLADMKVLSYGEAYDRILRYAEFLERPLNLGMFVPCDKKMNVLKNPDKSTQLAFIGDRQEYKQAKERILFEGWHYISKWYGTHVIAKDNEGKNQICIGDYSNIEKLMEDRYLTLTPTAIKQIGL